MRSEPRFASATFAASLAKTSLAAFVAIALLVTLPSCASREKHAEEAGPEYREKIRVTVLSHARELRNCYYRAIDEKPMSEGRINVGWVIDSDGHVKDPKLVSADPKIEHVYPCVEARLKSWSFPPTPNGIEVEVGSYPMVFSETGRIGPAKNATTPSNASANSSAKSPADSDLGLGPLPQPLPPTDAKPTPAPTPDPWD